MLYLDLFNGNVQIPLTILTGFSYTKTGQIIETSKNKFRCRGFACREIAIDFTLTPVCVEDFGAPDFRSLCNYFTDLVPEKDSGSWPVYLAGKPICPELRFSLTSTTNTFQCDFNGSLQELSVSWVLTSTAVSKDSSITPSTSYDENTSLPRVVLNHEDSSVNCADDISIVRLETTPTTLRLGLLLSNGFKEKNSNAWVYEAASNTEISIEGLGEFYVLNASTNEDYVEYEASIFKPEANTPHVISALDTTLENVLNKLNIQTNSSKNISNISIETFISTNDDITNLKSIQNNLGILIGFKDNKAYLFEVPNSIEGNLLNYFITDDLVSSKTKSVIWRDGKHEFKSGSGSPGITINSQICTSDDRSTNVLKFVNFMENTIKLNIPYNKEIKHFSQVGLNYNNNILPALVTDFTANLLENTMELTLNYIRR